MGRNLSVFIIALIILGGAIWENIFIEKTLSQMSTYCDSLYIAVQNETANTELFDMVEECKTYWIAKEKLLCLVVSHRDLSPITTTLSHLYSSIEDDNVDDKRLYSYILKEDIKQLSHIVAFRAENIL